MTVINRDNAERYQWGAESDAWYRCKSGHLSVIEERVPPGAEEASHYHRKSHQVFFVLEGTVSFTLGKQHYDLEPGDSLEVPAGKIHSLVNPGDEAAFVLVISTPESHSDRVDTGDK